MADPITIGLLLTAAGAGVSAFSSIKQGQVAEAQGKFAKQVAIRNQQSLERQRKAELDAASIKERRVARQKKIVKGRQRATAGKSGGQIAGATLSFLADTARQFSIERNLTLRTGLIRGRELREQGQIEIAKGRFARTIGKERKRLSFISATGSILTAAGALSFARGRGIAGKPLADQSPLGVGFGLA